MFWSPSVSFFNNTFYTVAVIIRFGHYGKSGPDQDIFFWNWTRPDRTNEIILTTGPNQTKKNFNANTPDQTSFLFQLCRTLHYRNMHHFDLTLLTLLLIVTITCLSVETSFRSPYQLLIFYKLELVYWKFNVPTSHLSITIKPPSGLIENYKRVTNFIG